MKEFMCGANSGWIYSRSLNVILTSWKSLLGAATALHSSRYWAHVHCSVLLSPASPQIWEKRSVNSALHYSSNCMTRGEGRTRHWGLPLCLCEGVERKKQILHSTQAQKWRETAKKVAKRTNIKKKRPTSSDVSALCFRIIRFLILQTKKNRPQANSRETAQLVADFNYKLTTGCFFYSFSLIHEHLVWLNSADPPFLRCRSLLQRDSGIPSSSSSSWVSGGRG